MSELHRQLPRPRAGSSAARAPAHHHRALGAQRRVHPRPVRLARPRRGAARGRPLLPARPRLGQRHLLQRLARSSSRSRSRTATASRSARPRSSSAIRRPSARCRRDHHRGGRARSPRRPSPSTRRSTPPRVCSKPSRARARRPPAASTCATIMPHRTGTSGAVPAPADDHGDLLALISKVGVTLLASATLDETLRSGGAPRLRGRARRALPHHAARGRAGRAEDSRRRDARPPARGGRGSRQPHHHRGGRQSGALRPDLRRAARPALPASTVTFQGIRSVLAVPLGVGDRIFGMIYADSPLADLALLGRPSQGADDARLGRRHPRREHAAHRRAPRTASSFERELQLAREIQQRFQPTAPPVVPGFELQGISFPSYQIGGDYYDFILRPDGRLVIALGDVSGKGTARRASDVQLARGRPRAGRLVPPHHRDHRRGQPLPRRQHAGQSLRHALLRRARPAHRLALLHQRRAQPAASSRTTSGTLEHLGAGGVPLGILPDFDFREGRTQLRPGDVLVAYSDGVTETQNPAGEEFGTIRLQEVIAQNLDTLGRRHPRQDRGRALRLRPGHARRGRHHARHRQARARSGVRKEVDSRQ